MLTVHLRVNDAATGQPTPARLCVSAPDGTHFFPLGRSADFPTGRNEAVGGVVKLGGQRWFYSDGWCEIALPAGVPLRVQASKGPEFRPLDQTVTLGPGQMTLRFALERWTDPRADGWVSVDTRCHFLTPHDALLEAAAEDLDVVNLLATPQPFPSLDGTAYPTVPNLTAFSGQTPALERHGRSVVVNTLNTHPVLGQVALLNSHRPVFPLTFGGDEPDDWGLCDWCDQCHRKGGLVVWVDAFEPAGGLIGGEALVAAVLGKIDALEVTDRPRKVPLMPWVYRLWTAGYPVPLVGASGKDRNTVALGCVRTYARPEPGGRSWVEAARAGHTFVTSGPLLTLRRDGHAVQAEARSLTPFLALELIADGRPIATDEPRLDPASNEYRAALPPTDPPPDSSWLAARCRFAAAGVAHTSPLVLGPGRPDPEPDAAAAASSSAAATAAATLVKLIRQTRDWVEQAGRFTNPKRREQLLARCREAAAKLGAEL
jgi:hypothetical protein